MTKTLPPWLHLKIRTILLRLTKDKCGLCISQTPPQLTGKDVLMDLDNAETDWNVFLSSHCLWGQMSDGLKVTLSETTGTMEVKTRRTFSRLFPGRDGDRLLFISEKVTGWRDVKCQDKIKPAVCRHFAVVIWWKCVGIVKIVAYWT